MQLAVEVKNLTKTFHRKCRQIAALKQIDFQVSRGETVVLMGPNGAGKTTLLKILATLILPNNGSANVFGLNCAKEERQVKKKIGFLSSDDRNCFWRLTGRQNLDFFAGLFGLSGKERRRKIGEFQELFDLSFLDQRVGEYSTGMKKRLSLARCLMHNPDLLLLDEPTKGLDSKTSDRLNHYLKEELSKKNGKTMMVVTHHLPEMEKVAGRVLRLENGRLVS
ncbi:MAG: ABC transporter ATP-binding protein [Deltaproteobacteria bacterium]|nr:ABC transporter ATP-binding protein [Deltaproteobacteria bacterium]